MWVSDLRRSHPDAAKHAWAILALLVKRFRQQWPEVKILFRGDSGFCRHQRMTGCERHGVGYILGIGRNNRITRRAQPWLDKAERLITKAHPRYLVTNLCGDPKPLYEQVYCARGEMENAIKQPPLDRFADRTSCHRWWANPFRMLLSSLAYILLERLRQFTLKQTALAHAYVGTIRLKLLKIGAVMIHNPRRIRFLCASSTPHQALFTTVVARLVPD